jgi:iron-sulfur cluster repair protein YtfE (RIC family)
MTIQLGRARSGGPETLVSLLAACHERIRSFAALGARVAEPGHTDALRTDACARVGRYFGEALPLHMRDEEDSVLPRLVGRSPALDALLARMVEQHREHDSDVAELVARCAHVVAHGPAADQLLAIAAVAARLVVAFEVHLAAEEAELFPHVESLPPALQDAIVAELRERRRAGAH